MSYDPDDLGLDLARAAALPECMACRKKSDGAVREWDGTVLCGTHHDECLRWIRDIRARGIRRPVSEMSPAAFAANLRATTYRACWEAIDDR